VVDTQFLIYLYLSVHGNGVHKSCRNDFVVKHTAGVGTTANPAFSPYRKKVQDLTNISYDFYRLRPGA